MTTHDYRIFRIVAWIAACIVCFVVWFVMTMVIK